MLKKKHHKKLNFTPVAMTFIVVGVIFFVLGFLMIIFASPDIIRPGLSYLITIGGAVIIQLGYTNLELGLIRKELEK
jgi:hypothetical protein